MRPYTKADLQFLCRNLRAIDNIANGINNTIELCE